MNNPKCCICGNLCEDQYGNNPDPLIKDEGARCCNKCNDTVISFRIESALMKKKSSESEKISNLIESNPSDKDIIMATVDKMLSDWEDTTRERYLEDLRK